MKNKLEIFIILPKITIIWEIYIHFEKKFYTKVSHIRRLTLLSTGLIHGSHMRIRRTTSR